MIPKGAYTALVTPFVNGEVDENALRELIDFQISEGIDGIVPCGTTGESATLAHEEHKHVIEVAIDAARGKVPVIAGTGSNSTDETIALTKHAKEAGADAVLLITPYYNKPTQEGLFQHFSKVAQEVDIPQLLYNVPGRTALNMLPETISRLSKLENIVGIKEATADMEQISWIRELCGEELDIMSGDDATVLPLLSIGGSGVISVVSNIMPKEMSALCSAFFSGNYEEAQRLHYRLLPLARVLFCETNPIPVKEALHLMGKITQEIRLPLTRLSEENRTRLQDVMKTLEVI
ncbi:MAG: 4-hydroxy-tetrahydrodipicolinate synthase [Proteobacteria bacterium]|nr:4-hydroxy-tetrahydrodipicolinate synthase [Pseudomonadota bacterium]